MKSILIHLQDSEYEDMLATKGIMPWRQFILQLSKPLIVHIPTEDEQLFNENKAKSEEAYQKWMQERLKTVQNDINAQNYTQTLKYREYLDQGMTRDEAFELAFGKKRPGVEGD